MRIRPRLILFIFFEKATRALLHFDFDLFFQDIWPILWPMMVGCIPYYIAAWLASYYLVKKALEKIGGNGGKKVDAGNWQKH
ncbi:MAG: hypothetical protein ACLSBF_05995 [Alphaproteobacteria bacterium]